MRRASGVPLLIVDDEPHVSDQLAAAPLASDVAALRRVPSLQLGIDALSDDPLLVIVEACLPDGNALELVRAVRAMQRPPIVIAVSGRADRQLVAALMLEGADAYFDKPVSREQLARSYRALSDAEALCRRLGRQLVGRMGLKEAQLCLRWSMHVEAMARTGGSRRAAAKLLKVQRSYVQRLAEDLPPDFAAVERT